MSLAKSFILSIFSSVLINLCMPNLHAQQVLEKQFHDNGQVSALWFDMGADRIQVIRFYANGQLREVGNWESGMMHGSWANWAENGTKLGEAEYRYGRRSGTWRLWDASGTHRYDLEYKSDALVAYSEP